MNTGNLAFGFQPILAAECLLGQTALVLCQFSCVFCGVAGIAGFKTVAGDEQILDAYINAHLFIRDRQQRGIKFTQARHEVASCLIFGNGNSSRVRRKGLTPFDSQWLVTLCQLQFTALKGESAVSEFSRLAVFFGFKGRVFCPTFKEVLERSLLVPQALLQRGAGNVIQESQFRRLLDGCQSGISANVAHLLLRLVVGIRAVTKNAVVNKAHTAERLSQQRFLLRVRVEAELVGAFDSHASHCILQSVTYQQPIANLLEEREEGRLPADALSLPDLKDGVSRAKLMKKPVS